MCAQRAQRQGRVAPTTMRNTPNAVAPGEVVEKLWKLVPERARRRSAARGRLPFRHRLDLVLALQHEVEEGAGGRGLEAAQGDDRHLAAQAVPLDLQLGQPAPGHFVAD